jgi:hypothetical protein
MDNSNEINKNWDIITDPNILSTILNQNQIIINQNKEIIKINQSQNELINKLKKIQINIDNLNNEFENLNSKIEDLLEKKNQSDSDISLNRITNNYWRSPYVTTPNFSINNLIQDK